MVMKRRLFVGLVILASLAIGCGSAADAPRFEKSDGDKYRLPK